MKKYKKVKWRGKAEVLSLFLGFLLLWEANSWAQSDLKLTWGGFLDTNYAFDLNFPSELDRAFTTQPARSNEFNLNLGYVDVKMESSKVRGRFAIQMGTSAFSNYAAEPRKGLISGPELSRHVQEATAGYAVGEKTWIDAGIFFSHVGAESWISRDNLNLTRSLVADYAPYYLSGVKFSHVASDRLAMQLLITNGWQNVSENNGGKNLGTSLEYSWDHLVLAYNTMLGMEVSGDLRGVARAEAFRHFHDLVLKSRDWKSWEWIAQFDVGFQAQPQNQGQSVWWGSSLMARIAMSESQKISLRLEHFQDPDQIILVTGRPAAFNGSGGSLGFDQQLEHGLLCRTELRYLVATENLFPKGRDQWAQQNLTLTTSLALSF
ncbi:MAG: porin [Bdellovibrionia bacterium]